MGAIQAVLTGGKTTLCVQYAELYTDYMQPNRPANLITAWSGSGLGKI